MAEDIDLEQCNFRNFRSPVTWTLTLDLVEVILVRTSGRRVYPHTKLHRNRQKNFLWTYGPTDTPEFSNSIKSSPGDDLTKIEQRDNNLCRSFILSAMNVKTIKNKMLIMIKAVCFGLLLQVDFSTPNFLLSVKGPQDCKMLRNLGI